MRPHESFSPPRRKLTGARVALLSLLIVVCGVGLVSGTAQSPQDETAAPAEEREFKSTVPEHVPIKVKVKNEQSFRKKENKNWARELEIEVKNTGSKPIYYLYVIVSVPEVIMGGHPVGFRVAYGRVDLAFLDTPIESDDVPIKPGESVTLKIREGSVRGYEKWRDKENKTDPKKVEFDMQIINFGDGTGLRGRDGRPYLLKKRSQNAPRTRGGGSACRPAPDVGEAEPTKRFQKAIYSLTPANFMRVNFSPPSDTSTSVPASPLPDQCGCQNSNDCMWGELGFATCPCDNPNQFPAILFAGGCANSSGECLRVITKTDPCPPSEFNGPQECTYQDEVGGCALGDPPPPPPPAPTPTPSPEGCIDRDGDTFCANRLIDQDCRDDDPDIFPGQLENCFNGIDDNCREGADGQDSQCKDSDFDGEADFFDCDPLNGLRRHGIPENCFDGVDNNCNEIPDPIDPECQSAGGGGGCTGPGYRCGVYAEVGVEGCYPEGSGACAGNSPVLVDVLGDGFRLTSAAAGVRFDIDGDGRREQLSWTAAGSDDAWLALDRHGSGAIDSGLELFGNFTWQARLTDNPNGFIALELFDRPAQGGNADRIIDSRDAVFASLRLWQDVNHNGVSEASELHTLPALNVAGINLDYKESKRVDEHGNRFRYRAKVEDVKKAKAGRWAWDVFLVYGQ